MSDTIVTTTIKGAQFSDGSTLSGSWTADYNSAGVLQSVTNATFTVSGSGGTTTFTSMGTLPYANSPSSSSYEIHSLSQTGSKSYSALYLDWRSENPSALYEGTPSLYTSILNSSSSTPSTALRLVSDGTTGVGSVPMISGLAATENGTDNAALAPFSGVTITDSDSTTTTSATITLAYNGTATDADGTLSGAGLTKLSTGTYSLAFTTPANLTSELQALQFTPTKGQVAMGSTVATRFNVSVNDNDGSASAATTLSVTAVCFLRGVMIETPSGEAAVESLRPGDLVTVLEDGAPVARPVRWVGQGAMDAAGFGHRTEAFPVRVCAGAFAPGKPRRDLLVTPEHCVLTEAGLTPVRMLVNGGSILVARDLLTYAYFHVELERHGILLAEGLPAESYLDTGNRHLLTDATVRMAALPDRVTAAPLAVARELVEPIWMRLAERARALGFDCHAAAGAGTRAPDLRLLLDNGDELAAWWQNGRRHMFEVPCGTRPVRLISRCAVPAEVIGPFVDDRRSLGVAVDQLVLWSGPDRIAVPIDELELDGWHAPEGSHRWTNGSAALEMPKAGPKTFLDISLVATVPCREPFAA